MYILGDRYVEYAEQPPRPLLPVLRPWGAPTAAQGAAPRREPRRRGPRLPHRPAVQRKGGQ